MEPTALAFGSLFLGLVFGRQPVELLVAPPVASVELRLDGRQVATLPGAPWRAEVDFGAELLPHHLDAVGRDVSGREVARCRQRVNLPRAAAEVEVVLEQGANGGWTGARLSYLAAEWKPPRNVQVELDGVQVAADTSRVVRWPLVGREQVHLLRVVVEFDDAAVASREVVFGGEVAAEAESVLTGVALQYERPWDAPRLAELKGRLRVQGRPAAVMAAEKGQARLVLVIEPAAHAALRRVALKTLAPRHAADLEALEGGDTVLRVDPRPDLHAKSDGYVNAVFPVRHVSDVRVDELVRLLLAWQPSTGGDSPARLVDAVGVAGLVASVTNQRRAVVLVLGGPQADVDPARVAVMRRFLESIGVPLAVWSVAGDVAEMRRGPWGSVLDISTGGGLLDADRRLQKLLRRQRVCWVEGDWLPQELSLDGSLRGVSIAGRE